MYFDQNGAAIVVNRDGEYDYDDAGNEFVRITEQPIETCAEVLEALAYSIDIDFIELLNEGWPVYLGNSYARYEFVALADGFVYTYHFGPNELDELNEKGLVTLEPHMCNELEAVLATEYMKCA